MSSGAPSVTALFSHFAEPGLTAILRFPTKTTRSSDNPEGLFLFPPLFSRIFRGIFPFFSSFSILVLLFLHKKHDKGARESVSGPGDLPLFQRHGFFRIITNWGASLSAHNRSKSVFCLLCPATAASLISPIMKEMDA
ncbi:MAG: hypothetical protein ACOC54_05020 [Candidatus Sumerlaeota bacterium]